jgi:hypothetical protein
MTYPTSPLTSILSPWGEEVKTSLLPIGEKVRMRGVIPKDATRFT